MAQKKYFRPHLFKQWERYWEKEEPNKRELHRLRAYHKYIRNNENGWGNYNMKDIRNAVPVTARKLAVKAVKALGLDFGAVDVVVDADRQPYVLEVNTAPGLGRRTLPVFTQHLINHIKG